MGKETLSRLRARLADAMEEQDTLSGLRAKVADAVGETPVEPIHKSWEYAVSEYAAEHDVTEAAAMMALTKTPEGAARYKMARAIDQAEAERARAAPPKARPTNVRARVDKEWPHGSDLKHQDAFLRSKQGRALLDLRRRFGDLEPVEALAKLRAERHTDLAKSLNQDVEIEFLRKWVTEEQPRAR